jgi:hypothetical protein
MTRRVIPLHLQKLTLTLLTSGIHSVSIVSSQTKATEFNSMKVTTFKSIKLLMMHSLY